MPLRMFNFLRETSKWRPAEEQFCVGDNNFESLKMTQSIVVQGNNLLTLLNFFNFVFKFLLFSVFFQWDNVETKWVRQSWIFFVYCI